MLIAIGLSTAVIVGVPILMYAINTLSLTSQLQEAQLAAEQIHNVTRNVDTGMSNTTSTTIWINPGLSVTANGNILIVAYNEEGAAPKTWSASYNHDIVIDHSILTASIRVLYSMEASLVGEVIHIAFLEVPI
ncbi:MAG: hypothetical protein EAX87_08015 [Candidatus Thorarchaeota archaeon]|nr:hypothetical protein [Candidatus Thorarchaeota archaeon]